MTKAGISIRTEFLLVILFIASMTATAAADDFSRFVGIEDCSTFTKSINANGETVLTPPVVKSGVDWNQLVVSWNASAPTGSWLRVEAAAVFPDGRISQFYTLGTWSPDRHFSHSFGNSQKNADGQVSTDTLILSHPASGAQVRLTLGGTNAASLRMKFLGLSFCDTRVQPADFPPNRAAWGKIIATPELSQNAYPQNEGSCSSTSLSMVLERWGRLLHRPEMDLDEPAVAASVEDTNFGYGNWPFNTAFAGSFDGMRAYVTRFTSMSELEDWVQAGIPVIISAPWHLLQPGRPNTGSGHLTVCIGFTVNGDVVINDPATNVKTGQVRHIYKREDVIHAWSTSHNAVYLVYPLTAKVPTNRLGQWFDSTGR